MIVMLAGTVPFGAGAAGEKPIIFHLNRWGRLSAAGNAARPNRVTEILYAEGPPC